MRASGLLMDFGLMGFGLPREVGCRRGFGNGAQGLTGSMGRRQHGAAVAPWYASVPFVGLN